MLQSTDCGRPVHGEARKGVLTLAKRDEVASCPSFLLTDTFRNSPGEILGHGRWMPVDAGIDGAGRPAAPIESV